MTECINPNVIREGDLSAYADGQAGDAVREHIEICEYCRNRVDDFRRLDQLLLTGLYRSACPRNDLQDWQRHLLSPARALVVAAHARKCPLCTRDLVELRVQAEKELPPNDIIKVLAQKMKEKGREILRWAEAGLFPERVVTMGDAPLQKDLVTDSGVEISLWVKEVGDNRKLEGDLYHPKTEDSAYRVGVEVWLVQQGQVTACSTTDDKGHFEIQNVPPDQYDLGFTWPEIGEMVLVRDVGGNGTISG